MAVNPKRTIQKMRKEMISAMKDLQKPDNIEKLKKLKLQIQKLQKIGGLDAIVPSEGIVFKYKGKYISSQVHLLQLIKYSVV